jgi:hypothetical protein
VGSVVVGEASIQARIDIEAKARAALRHHRYCSNLHYVQ